LTQVVCNDDAGPNTPCAGTPQSVVQFNATACVTYFIRVAGSPGAIGEFRLSLNQAINPPANDLCGNATPITAGSWAWNNDGANTDGPTTGACVPRQDVWFSYTAPCNGTVWLDTCGSMTPDTLLAVYSGPCAALNLINCNDNATMGPCQGSNQSFLSFNAVQGQTYRIRVGTPAGITGCGVLNLQGPLPPVGTVGNNPTCSWRWYRIIGSGNGTPWAWSLSSPCCANLQNLNVPGVTGSAAQLAAAFAASINSAAPGSATSFTINWFGFPRTYLAVRLCCGPNAPVNLSVGSAGSLPQNLCLVKAPWVLPTTGPCSFNPEIVEEPLSGQDANGNGIDDWIDIAFGTSEDANGNGIPDEAETCLPPEFLEKPDSQAVVLGEDVTLSVEVTGTPPFQYHWYHDGDLIPGATGNTLSFTPATAADLGDYVVVVSNDCGEITSPEARLDDPATASLDFGDAPSAAQSGFAADYPTLEADDGARHHLPAGGATRYLGGAAPDGEGDGQPSAAAAGDGIEEDGLTLPASFVVGRSATVTVAVTGDADLDGWIDWNQDGDWNDAGEQVFASLGLTAADSPYTLGVTVPGTALLGTTYARFRYSTVYGLGPSGTAVDGEVEDYLITVTSPPPTAARLAYFRALTSGGDAVRLTWSTLVENSLLGFRLDRSTGDGDWTRLTEAIIPATGGNLQPQTYSMVDGTPPALAGLTYRLVGIDLRGQENLLAEAVAQVAMTLTISSAGEALRLDLRGAPHTTGVVETATALAGPWTQIHSLTLDERGAWSVSLDPTSDATVRFYRVSSVQ